MSAPFAALDAGLDAPLGRKTASELVVQRILDLVRAGRLGPGDRLPPERELAATLRVSRPTLREALRALAILGVLDIRHGGGVTVASLEPADLASPLDLLITLAPATMGELFDARIAYEPLVARLAATRLAPAALSRLREIVEAQVASPGDAEAFHDTDVEFHRAVMDAAGNPYLARVGKLLQVLGERGRRAFQGREDVRRRSVADHGAILAAFEARDPGEAERAMREHMTHVREALREVTGA